MQPVQPLPPAPARIVLPAEPRQPAALSQLPGVRPPLSIEKAVRNRDLTVLKREACDALAALAAAHALVTWLAVGAGKWIGGRVDEQLLYRLSGGLFLAFGLLSLVQALGSVGSR